MKEKENKTKTGLFEIYAQTIECWKLWQVDNLENIYEEIVLDGSEDSFSTDHTCYIHVVFSFS